MMENYAITHKQALATINGKNNVVVYDWNDYSRVYIWRNELILVNDNEIILSAHEMKQLKWSFIYDNNMHLLVAEDNDGQFVWQSIVLFAPKNIKEVIER